MARILIIENDKLSLNELRSWLTNEGYELEVASSGQEGLKRLKKADCDVAVVNWQLADMDGAEFCRLVSTSNLFLPILVLSKSTDVDQRIAALDAGAQDFLQQPCQLLELSARLRSLLRRYAKKNVMAPPVVLPVNHIVNMPS